VDLEVEREREARREVEQIDAGGEDGEVDVGVRAGPATGTRAEEEGKIDIVAACEGTAEALGNVTRRHASRA
jgi:hypothetical protein